MNKRIVITFTIVLTAVIAFGIYIAALFPANSTKVEKPVSKTSTVQPETKTAAPVVKAPGSYQIYSDTAYASAKDSRRILFFHAPWCPQCRQLDKEITANKLPDGIAILKVDYDTSSTLRAKYGVTLQTTFIEVDADGNKVKGVVAYNEPTYANLTKQLTF